MPRPDSGAYRDSRYDELGNVRCARCRIYLPPTAFAVSRAKTGRHAGREWPQSQCRKCFAESVRIRRSNR